MQPRTALILLIVFVFGWLVFINCNGTDCVPFEFEVEEITIGANTDGFRVIKVFKAGTRSTITSSGPWSRDFFEPQVRDEASGLQSIFVVDRRDGSVADSLVSESCGLLFDDTNSILN